MNSAVNGAAGDRKVELRIAGENGVEERLGLNPVVLGTRGTLTAWIISSNAPPVQALAADWIFPSNVFFVADFRFSQAFGMATPLVTEGPNPITFVPWFINGQVGPPAPTQAIIQCSAQAPDGEWLPCEDILPISAPTIILTEDFLTESTIPTVDNSQMQGSFLNYSSGEEGGLKLSLEFAGLPNGAQLALIQTVNSYRLYTLADGSTVTLATTNQAFFLDTLGIEVFFEGPVTNTEEDLTLTDLPQQPLPLMLNGQEVESSEVSDQFLLYVVYKATPGHYDPNNLWTPIAQYGWGWYARAVLTEANDTFELDPNNSAIQPFTAAPMTQMYWSGSMPDSIIQPNGAPNR